MSTPATILGALKSQLEADTTLGDYIKKVFLGVREDVSEFPCIILEPLGISEGDEIHNRQELTMRVAMICYIRVFDADKQIVGTTEVKGILDIENDVKKAISADLTIGGNVLHATMPDTRYEFTDYPIRSFTLEVALYFRQTLTTRT